MYHKHNKEHAWELHSKDLEDHPYEDTPAALHKRYMDE